MLKHLTAAGLLLSAFAFAVPATAATYGSGNSSSPMMHNPPSSMKSMMMMAPWKLIHTRKGTVWADSRGFALYTFAKDPPGRATCYGACAVAWPPFYAPMGAQPMGKWSIVWRFGMARQWAYNGHPLYFFFKDTRPGQVNGDGVNNFHVAR